MQETGFSYIHDREDPVSISTTSYSERCNIRDRLDDRGADYKMEDHYYKDDYHSTEFYVPHEHIRRPHKIIKTTRNT